MTNTELAKKAFEECCSEKTTVRYGIPGERPFWNVESCQFMYVPAFHFTEIRGNKRYRFDAIDEKNVKHTFEAESCCALLTPIWAELPEGVVTLTVTAIDVNGKDLATVGTRTFFKLASFPSDPPSAVRSYKECAIKGYEYALSQDFVQYWLKYGKPDPYYDLNVYPSKMVSGMANAMLSYAAICPENKETAMKIAVNAADFLISITPRGDVPLRNLPPTYDFDFCPDPDKYGVRTWNWHNAEKRKGCIMMTYPASAGRMYLSLYNATGDKKYFNEALNIGQYYLENVEENGSWYLIRSMADGKPVGSNYISTAEVLVPFLMALYENTGDVRWKNLGDNAMDYAMKNMLPAYNWEGQFEDAAVSVSYSNLSHYAPGAILKYITKYRADEPEMIELAKELMRFIEDQFVVWKRHNPWCHCQICGGEWNSSKWPTPAGLEQYKWYVPIDASTSNIANDFLALYEATGEELYLAKAKALANQLTVMQEENGKIPTHWMETEQARNDLWFNCLFGTCRILATMSKYE